LAGPVTILGNAANGGQRWWKVEVSERKRGKKKKKRERRK
jgi:hypothetical protein